MELMEIGNRMVRLGKYCAGRNQNHTAWTERLLLTMARRGKVAHELRGFEPETAEKQARMMQLWKGGEDCGAR